MLSVVGKFFACVLAYRLLTIAKEALPESSCGFGSAQGTVDIFISMTDSGKVKRTDLYMAFIDVTKAFDSNTTESALYGQMPRETYQNGMIAT